MSEGVVPHAYSSANLRYSRVVSGPLGSSRVLSGPLGSSRVLSGTLGYSRVLSGTLGYSRGARASGGVAPRERLVLCGSECRSCVAVISRPASTHTAPVCPVVGLAACFAVILAYRASAARAGGRSGNLGYSRVISGNLGYSRVLSGNRVPRKRSTCGRTLTDTSAASAPPGG